MQSYNKKKWSKNWVRHNNKTKAIRNNLWFCWNIWIHDKIIEINKKPVAYTDAILSDWHMAISGRHMQGGLWINGENEATLRAARGRRKCNTRTSKWVHLNMSRKRCLIFNETLTNEHNFVMCSASIFLWYLSML